MQHAELTELVRQMVIKSFGELDASDDDGLHETILIRGGFYCGRRFKIEGFEAIWFIEEKQIKFYGDASELNMIDLNERVDTKKRAA
ncbi:MAG: hypothetical protein ACI9G1_001978 [Pirellulaceae bacterium]|jgi:hypothetical protein